MLREQVKIQHRQQDWIKKQRDDCLNDTGLRFTADVLVKIVEHLPAKLAGPSADQYEALGSKPAIGWLSERSAMWFCKVYLVDVLQRITQPPASDVSALTPQLWKDRFADNLLLSLINPSHLDRQNTLLELIRAY